MKTLHLHPASAASVVEARYAYRVAAALTEGQAQMPHDIGERLKVARQMALQRAAAQRARAVAPQVAGGGNVQIDSRGNATLSWFGGAFGAGSGQGGSRWLRFASILPAVALVVGLVAIQQQHVNAQITEAAQIDADLLGDTVPPDAYRDAGFVEFLKTPRN